MTVLGENERFRAVARPDGTVALDIRVKDEWRTIATLPQADSGPHAEQWKAWVFRKDAASS